MAYPYDFWDGVQKTGTGLGGLIGAYSLASTWGSVSSVVGLLAGAAGILVGGILGAFVGAFVLTVAVSITALVVGLVSELISNTAEGLGMMFGCK